MKEVADKTHLVRRGEVWHYNRRVPKSLVSVVGKAFIKKSLGTKSLPKARKLRNVLDVGTDALFEEAAAAIFDEPNVTSSAFKHAELSLDCLTAYVRKHIEKLDTKSAGRLLENPPLDADELADMRMDAEIGLGILKNPSDPRRDEWVHLHSQAVLKTAGVDSTDEKLISGLAEVVRRGLIELQRREIDRYNDEYGSGSHDPLFDSTKQTAVTFAELVEIYLQERKADYTANDVAIKRFDKITAESALITEIIGGATPVGSIKDDMVQKVRMALAVV